MSPGYPQEFRQITRKEFKYTTYGRYQLSARRLLGFTIAVLLGSAAITCVFMRLVSVGV